MTWPPLPRSGKSEGAVQGLWCAGAWLGTSPRIPRLGVEWDASGNSVEGSSPAAGGATSAIVRLEDRDDPDPRLRDLRAVSFAGREFRGEPAFGGKELKSRPRGAPGADTVIQGLLVGVVDLVEVPRARRIEADDVDGESVMVERRATESGPPVDANPDYAAG